MTQDWLSNVQVTTTSEGTGDIVLGAVVDATWQAFAASLDGKVVDVEIEHQTESEKETGRYVYDHSPTPTLLRGATPDADVGVEWSTAGVGVKQAFSPGVKRVGITINAKTLRELVLFRGGGRTINEDTDFTAGGTFTVSLANDRHRSLKISGFADGALTQAMTVALPDPDTAQWGDEIYLEKGDSSTLAVTVFGFDNSETGTFSLDRKDQYIVAKLVGLTERKWERTRGGQQDPTPFGQDIMRAANAATAKALLSSLTSIKTANYQAMSWETIRTDTNSTVNGFQVTAPISPSDGDQFTLEDAAEGGSWSLAKPVLLIAGGSTTLAGNNGPAGVNHDGGTSAVWRYSAAADDWAYVGEPAGGHINLSQFLQDVVPHIHGSVGAVAPNLTGVGALTITMNANGTGWAPTNVLSTTSKRFPLQVDFVQGAIGNRTLDLSAVNWGDAAAPILPATAGSVLSVIFEYRGGLLRGLFQRVDTA